MSTFNPVVRWICRISFFRFAAYIVVKDQFTGLEFSCTRLEEELGSCLRTGEDFLQSRDLFNVNTGLLLLYQVGGSLP